MLVHDRLGTFMQQVGAAVVAESLPEVQHVVYRGGGEALDIGEAVKEAVVIGNDGGDGGLLEHDFGKPDVVGAAAFIPPWHGPVAAGVPR